MEDIFVVLIGKFNLLENHSVISNPTGTLSFFWDNLNLLCVVLVLIYQDFVGVCSINSALCTQGQTTLHQKYLHSTLKRFKLPSWWCLLDWFPPHFILTITGGPEVVFCFSIAELSFDDIAKNSESLNSRVLHLYQARIIGFLFTTAHISWSWFLRESFCRYPL